MSVNRTRLILLTRISKINGDSLLCVCSIIFFKKFVSIFFFYALLSLRQMRNNIKVWKTIVCYKKKKKSVYFARWLVVLVWTPKTCWTWLAADAFVSMYSEWVYAYSLLTWPNLYIIKHCYLEKEKNKKKMSKISPNISSICGLSTSWLSLAFTILLLYCINCT